MASLLTELPVDENIICSPFSVRMALAMLLPGARGETCDQIEDFVGPDHKAELATVLSTLRTNRDGAIRFSLANGAFLQPRFPVLPAYSEAITGPLRAQIENLDFGDPTAAAARINEWVEKATEGMISNLLSPETIERLTSLVLVNAIYYFAAWENPFEELLTQLERFHPLRGADYDVPMMRQTRLLPYAVDDESGIEAVRIPYRATSLVVVLPRRGRFEEVARSFGEDRVAGIAGLRLSEREVELRLPRFEIESRLSLVDALSHLGVRVPFDPNHADFGDLTDHPEGLFVGAVEHGARIRVDEQGTEAAAATAVMSMVRGVPPKPLQFHVDRPFLFFVYDDKSETVLFAGRCVSPKATDSDSSEALPAESVVPEAGVPEPKSRRSGLRDFLARLSGRSRGR